MAKRNKKDAYIELAISILSQACSEKDHCKDCIIFKGYDMTMIEDCPLNTMEVPANWDLDTLYEQAFDRAEPDLAEMIRKGDIYGYV
jgi:hypothetical protein